MKEQHTWWKIKASVLLLTVAIAVSMTSCATKEETVVVTEKEETVVVTAKDAIAYIQKMEDLGYENATSDLVERNTAHVDGNSYIRLQQRYKGIPVAGRSIVYIADDRGNATEISTNAKDIDPDLDLTPVITAEQVQQSIQEYAKDTPALENAAQLTVWELTEDMLWIYCTDTADRLAYRLNIGAYTVFIDAHDGAILACFSSMSLDNVVYTDAHGENPIRGFEKVGGEYILGDSERNIYIFKASDKDEKDGTGFILKESNQRQNYDFNYLSPVTSDKTEFDEEAYNFLLMLRKVYDYYNTNFEEKHDALMGVYNDFLSTKKAGGGFFVNNENKTNHFLNCPLFQGNNAFKSCAMVDIGKGIAPNEDLIGHEYTHTVQQKYLDKSNQNPETNAVKEGLADIMGELFEFDSKGSCDWIHGDRNLKDPGIYPSTMSELVLCQNGHVMAVGTDITHKQCCVSSIRDVNHCLWDYAHGASTIISHCGYLMSTDAKGENQGLTNTQLAKLIYLTTLRMPDNFTFMQFRQCMERAAETMDELTPQQRICIQEAFDAVGITIKLLHTDSKLLHTGSKLSVVNAIGIPQEEYTLEIVGDYEYADDFLSHIRREYNATIQITTANPYKLDLPVGYYTITVSANGASCTRNIAIVPKLETEKADSELKVYLDFGLIEDAYCAALKLPDQVERCYHIPKIVEDTCTKVNQKIYDDYYQAVEDTIRCVQSYREFYFLNGVSYIYGKRGDILSIVMIASGDSTSYRIYNVSLSTGEEVSTQELLAQAYGITMVEFKQTVRNVYEKWVEEIVSGMLETTYKQYVRQYTLSDENISNAVPFIGPDGQLCFLGIGHFPAGSGVQEYLYDTQRDTYLSQERCGDHSDILQVITGDIGEEKAYVAACEFWGVTPEQAEEASDYWIACSGIETFNEIKYYKFYLRGSMDGGSSVSTLDVVYVDAWSGYATWSPNE